MIIYGIVNLKKNICKDGAAVYYEKCFPYLKLLDFIFCLHLDE